MKKINTEDCKKFLVKQYNQTVISEWKRLSKYKIDGINHRDFNHPLVGTVTVKEVNGNLQNNLKPSKSSLFTGMCDAQGDKLVNHSVEDTLISLLYDKNVEYELVSTICNDDSYDINYDGSSVTGYYYHADGRDIMLYVYDDDSWIMVSD